MAQANEVLELIDAPGRVALIRKVWEPAAITSNMSEVSAG